MSFSVGIVGLPNVGKSTLFQALTKKQVEIADYPFTTIHPNFGVVAVPDPRLEAIAKVVRPERVVPTVIEFVDIAGLVKDAHKGKGLGNQFLDQISRCDAILEIVDCFRANSTPNADVETIKTELEMKDLNSKPIVYVYNINPVRNSKGSQREVSNGVRINLKTPKPDELAKLISECYNALDLITFYTVKRGKQVQAWTLKKGASVLEAGRIVHSDFVEKFIKAQVTNWQKLIQTGSWLKAKQMGFIRAVGKDYLVEDGDVIEFKI
ncbi:MAG: hypothetical protein G01um101430_445 [Parcubacteria group bacterium Gr01-1014_30]|nr:MAG: hypothetical protein G01um101430_445 [Parcubacteria group bacterium Gr01-1014_30]